MDPTTSAARAEALAAREEVARQLDALAASAREAVDIPAKVRRNPGKTIGAAAGAGFLLFGGPSRVVSGVRKALGRDAPLPKSMLPEEIEKTLRQLGPDGEKVRGTLEREFARYLEEKAPERRESQLVPVLVALFAAFSKPVTRMAGFRVARELFGPAAPGLGERVERARANRPPVRY